MKNTKLISQFRELITKTSKFYNYCCVGIWSDTRDTKTVKVLKISTLTIKSFISKELYKKSCELTYNTILAIVPAFALLFAIGRGFGFQNLLQTELFKYFPAQQQALSAVLPFVDSYLQRSSQGIFLGIGILFLLWTLISLIQSIESAFNFIWKIENCRTIYRKITDYTAIFLILPIFIICEGGITLFMSALSSRILILSPILKFVLDILPYLLSWMFFSVSFILIPNTKVKLRDAILPGLLCSLAFQLLQYVFISGQIYVSNYNAIYGSFSILPLFLVWMQLTWVITLVGVNLTYSSQNINKYNFQDQISNISFNYQSKIAIIIYATIVNKFINADKICTQDYFVSKYKLPVTLVSNIIKILIDCNLIVEVISSTKIYTYMPSRDISTITINDVYNRIYTNGESLFLKEFDSKFYETLNYLDQLNDLQQNATKEVLIKDIQLD